MQSAVASVAFEDVSPRGKPNPRARPLLLAAAERVLRRDGVGAVTTRAVAREAQVASGLLYRHFADKDELLVALLAERLHEADERLSALPARAGTGSVRDNLIEIVAESLDALLAVAPLLSIVVARPELRSQPEKRAAGPDRDRAIVPLHAYLDAEARAGRLSAGVDLDAAASLLVGACHDLAFHRALHGDTTPVDRALAQRLVDTLLAGLDPAGARNTKRTGA